MIELAVIGSGAIGPDLAYGFASALSRKEFRLWLHDVAPAQLEKGLQRIRAYLDKAEQRGKLSPARCRTVLDSIRPTTVIGDLAACRYVLEAASENLAVKRRILAALEQVVSPDCLIGFATSGLPRAWICAEARHPDRCFVNHPFYPAWRSLPIELVPGPDARLTAAMASLLAELGKVPIVTADTPCFAADDVFCNLECEAFRLLAEGHGSPAQLDAIIDEAVGGGGPFRVADMTRGNELIAHCQELLAEHHGNPWFLPPDILTRQAGRLWSEDHFADAPHPDRQAIADRVLAVVLARSFHLMDEGICAPGDLDWLLRNSLGFRRGPLRLARELGMERVHEVCSAHAERTPGFPIPESVRHGRPPVGFEHLAVVGPDSEGVVELWVRRPEVSNALNAAAIGELEAALDQLEKDAHVRGIVLGGWGGALAGADIRELAALTSAAQGTAVARRGQALTVRIAQLSKPVVAIGNGPLLGGGAELCMAAHARVLGPGAVVGQPEVNLGIVPGYGGTQRLPRLIGVQPAYEMLATGEPVPAARAAALGWGVLSDDPDATARSLLRAHWEGQSRLAPVGDAPVAPAIAFVELGHHSRAIDRLLRRALHTGLVLPLAAGLEVEAETFGRCFHTLDMAIGMASFMANGPRVPAVFLHA